MQMSCWQRTVVVRPWRRKPSLKEVGLVCARVWQPRRNPRIFRRVVDVHKGRTKRGTGRARVSPGLLMVDRPIPTAGRPCRAYEQAVRSRAGAGWLGEAVVAATAMRRPTIRAAADLADVVELRRTRIIHPSPWLAAAARFSGAHADAVRRCRLSTATARVVWLTVEPVGVGGRALLVGPDEISLRISVMKPDPVVLVGAGRQTGDKVLLVRVVDASQLAAEALARGLGHVERGRVEREQVTVIAELVVAGWAGDDVGGGRVPLLDDGVVAGAAELAQLRLVAQVGAAVAAERQPEVRALTSGPRSPPSRRSRAACARGLRESTDERRGGARSRLAACRECASAVGGR